MTTGTIERAGPARTAKATERKCDIEIHAIEGRRLRAVRWKGAGEGLRPRPLLFFSGIGSNAEILAPFMERLAGRDVVTFDAPGIGGSDKSGGPYRFSTMARAAATILDRLGYDQADVMGVSWGGMLAQQFAHQYPERLGRLVLGGTTAGVIMVPGRVAALTMMLNVRRFNDAGFLRRNFDTLYGGDNRGWHKYAGGVAEPTSLGYLYQLAALAGWTSLGFLHTIAAKTLILGGTDDSLVRPVNLRVLKSFLKDPELHFIEGAGHMFLLSHLDKAASEVEAFLDRAE